MECKLKCVVVKYVDKSGVEKTATNYRVYFDDNNYININPAFKNDYYTLNALKRCGKIEKVD